MAAIVEHLFILEAGQEWSTLHEIGRSAEPLVLEGTIQQQFFCKLANTLGVRASVPGPVIRLVVRPMICALRVVLRVGAETTRDAHRSLDRKSTRLNSSHQIISYSVFCLKKK